MFSYLSKYNKLINRRRVNIRIHSLPIFRIKHGNYLFDKKKELETQNQIILETINFKILIFVSLTFTSFGLFMYYVYI
jgi:hypothetical protein